MIKAVSKKKMCYLLAMPTNFCRKRTENISTNFPAFDLKHTSSVALVKSLTLYVTQSSAFNRNCFIQLYSSVSQFSLSSPCPVRLTIPFHENVMQQQQKALALRSCFLQLALMSHPVFFSE